MKQIRRTEVIKAAVEYQGVESGGGTVKLKPGTGRRAPARPEEVFRSGHDRGNPSQVRHQRRGSSLHQAGHGGESRRPGHSWHVTAHRDDRIYLEGAYRGQVNGEIQTAYVERGRYEELSDLKYMDTGVSSTSCGQVIQQHLSFRVMRRREPEQDIPQMPKADRRVRSCSGKARLP